MSIAKRIKSKLTQVKAKLPFVRLFGYEKTYGKARIRDFNVMIENFKSWPYACIQRNAFSIARNEIKIYNKVIKAGETTLEEITEHVFLDLMNTVNPFFNKFELWVLTTIFLELTGNAYWWIVSDALGIPREIWSIPSNWVKVIPSKQQFIVGYTVQPPGEPTPIPFQERDLIHFKYPSPFDMHYGTGPLVAAQYGVDLNNHLKTRGINYLMNDAQPGGVLTTEDSLTEEQFGRLLKQWNRKHKGAENAGKMAILERGLKYMKVGEGLGEMKFNDINKSIRDEILAIFGVPASKLGLVEDVNRANAEANDYTYQKETIEPRLMLIEQKLNEKMMPRYDTGLVCKFVSPVPADKEFRLKQQGEHIRSGYSSIDDEREKDNLKPYGTPETQMPLIPFSVVPAGEEREKDEPEEPYDDDEKTMTKAMKVSRKRKWEIFAAMTAPQEKHFKRAIVRFFQAQRAEVMSNFNNYRSVAKEVKEGISANILFNIQEQDEKLKEISRPYIHEAVVSGASLAGEEMGIASDLIEPRVLRAIEKRLDFFPAIVNQGTIGLLRDELVEAINAGETIEEVAKRLDKVFTYNEHYRSVRVARTEVIGAANHGQLEIYRDADVEWKQWITARDEKIRNSHKKMDTQTVGITEDFTTGLGSRLQYPGDREHDPDPADVINCRCTVIAVRKKE